jgi:hypothetical protein
VALCAKSLRERFSYGFSSLRAETTIKVQRPRNFRISDRINKTTPEMMSKATIKVRMIQDNVSGLVGRSLPFKADKAEARRIPEDAAFSKAQAELE